MERVPNPGVAWRDLFGLSEWRDPPNISDDRNTSE
jgi:hypothetical protein